MLKVDVAISLVFVLLNKVAGSQSLRGRPSRRAPRAHTVRSAPLSLPESGAQPGAGQPEGSRHLVFESGGLGAQRGRESSPVGSTRGSRRPETKPFQPCEDDGC